MAELNEPHMMYIIDNALDSLEEYSGVTGLGGVVYPEDRDGSEGLSVAFSLYQGDDVLAGYRTAMRQVVRHDMVGMMLGVKNHLPGKETARDIRLRLMADEKEVNIHTVGDALGEALVENKDFLQGDEILQVSILTVHKTTMSGLRRNGGDTEFFQDDNAWETSPAIAAMRYWLDMP